MALTIYCDEAGFTGNNLADDGNPYFTFASVALEPSGAAALIDEAKAEFRLQGEVKGANLTKHPAGRNAAGKLFEYIFEPALSENNYLFYSIGFHRFIANLLHAEL